MDRDQWKVVLLQPDPGRNKRHPLRKPQGSGRLVCDRGRKPVRKERVVSGVVRRKQREKDTAELMIVNERAYVK